MAINKATLAKEIDGVIEYIYPKTSGDIVVYDETHSVNAMIQSLVENKVDKEDNKGLSTYDFTKHYRDKLDNIADNATKIILDSELSKTSVNGIQNKVVANRFESVENSISSMGTELQNLKSSVSGTVTEAVSGLTSRVETLESFKNDLGTALTVSGGKLCAIYATA